MWSLGRKTTRLVSLHTHLTSMEIFLSPITWGKLIQKSGRQNSPMLLLILLFFFSPFGSHSFIITVTELLLSAAALVPQQKNCHLEHLFPWLADDSTRTSKPNQISACILFSKHLMGTYLTPSDPSPVQRWAVFIWPSHWTLPPTHSIPPSSTQVVLLNKRPGYHPHPTATLTCCALAQTLIKGSKKKKRVIRDRKNKLE